MSAHNGPGGGGREIAAFYVRKEPKNTGTRELIEGHDIAGHQAVMMIEDVTTKGGSVIKAIEAVQRETSVRGARRAHGRRPRTGRPRGPRRNRPAARRPVHHERVCVRPLDTARKRAYSG